MANFEPNIYDIDVGGRTCTIEFDREALKEADGMGVFNDNKGILYERPEIILYAGLKMHKSDITINLARKIWEQMLDDGYTVKDFNDTIGDEFSRCFKHFFPENGKKKILPRKLQAVSK
jgi:hypothetical protein